MIARAAPHVACASLSHPARSSASWPLSLEYQLPAKVARRASAMKTDRRPLWGENQPTPRGEKKKQTEESDFFSARSR